MLAAMKLKTKALKGAYSDGWAACGRGLPRVPRSDSNYTSDERDAHDQGWDDRAERIALGYKDETNAQGS